MIYLDNSATTRTLTAAAKAARQYMDENFFNPAAAYAPAVESERAVNGARARLADAMHAGADEIIFTSGGTESNNMAIRGSLGAMRGRGRIIMSAVEHPSVFEVMRNLSAEYHVVEAGVDKEGRVDLGGLSQLLSLIHIVFCCSVSDCGNDISPVSKAFQYAAKVMGPN